MLELIVCEEHGLDPNRTEINMNKTKLIKSRLTEFGNQVQEDLANFLKETWITPVEKIGDIKFTDYGYAHWPTIEGGVHCLHFEWDKDLSDEDWKEIHEICTRDDDSQPEADYRSYMGSLMVFVPYFA